jgi:hypothetical protein
LNAKIIVSNLPIDGVHSFVPVEQDVDKWDINGDYVVDIEIHGHPWSTGIRAVNGAQFVVPASIDEGGMSRLDAGFSVGEILPTGYKFHTTEQPVTGVNRLLPIQNNNDSKLSSLMEDSGWTIGTTGYFGFKFLEDGFTYYGWGEFTINSLSFSIDKAWFEDQCGTPILVGTVPEPSTYTLIMGSVVFATLILRCRLK